MKQLLITLCALITAGQALAQNQQIYWDTITFEKPSPYLSIDTSTQNIWQIGRPSKINFDTAFSKSRAIVTDTVNSYPTNNHSYFDIYIGAFNIQWYQYSCFLKIHHRFNTDTLKDGGYISISYNNGKTWMNIINDTLNNFMATPYYDAMLLNKNLYSMSNTLFNGEHGFSGSSQGWITTKFGWYDIPVKKGFANIKDTIIIRFNFISNNIPANKDGWMIDDITLYSEVLSNVRELNDIKSIQISPNPFNQSTELTFDKSYHSIDIEVLDIQGKLIEKKQYTNTKTLQFDRRILNSGTYFFKIMLDNQFTVVKKIVIND